MRKHDVRKWLHACLDLLPVILIPVFMVYSHRHEINDGSIQVQEKIAVDFNQRINANEKLAVSYQFNAITSYEISITNDTTISDTFIYRESLPINHKYYFKIKSSTTNFRTSNQNVIPFLSANVLFNGYSAILVSQVQGISGLDLIPMQSIAGDTIISFNFIDLTQMYGENNEPSLSEFESYFPYYYEYTLSHKELVNKPSLTTYDDTDIMSQLTYQLYNAVDKYFNMGNVFNMNGVYDWFNLYIFHGSAPIYIYVVWQIVLYEFVMDLLFLLYGLFMWFIDMVQHLMDKPFKSIK